MKKFIIVVLALLFMIEPVKAGYVYEFAYISGDSPGSAVASQLSLEVTSGGGDIVNFTYKNDGSGTPIPSSLTDIYIDDGILKDLTIIDDDPGVDFEIDNVENCVFYPSYGISFVVDQYLSASNYGNQSITGINPGESLTLQYSLQGVEFYELINAINNQQDLKIGIKVKSIDMGPGTDYSTEFILVPLPATILLGMLGLGVGGWKMRKSLR